jgi:zinc/manganese transport system ATP-binding protein
VGGGITESVHSVHAELRRQLGKETFRWLMPLVLRARNIITFWHASVSYDRPVERCAPCEERLPGRTGPRRVCAAFTVAHVCDGPPARRLCDRRAFVGRRLLGAALNQRMLETAPIRLENLTLGYERRPAVHHVHGTIAPGASIAVCGPNGAGKSTLLKGLAGLLKPLGGRIEMGGFDAQDVAYLPQIVEIDRDFPLRLMEFVALGATLRSGLFGRIGRLELDRIEQAIAGVRLTGFEDRTLDTLSGGQMQRALFARLIVQDRRVILLDEPFGAIDSATTTDLLALINEWRAEGRTVVAVLHDLDLARRAFPKTLLLARQMIFWGDTKEALSDANLAKAHRMVEAFDREAEECLIDETGAGREHVH